MAARAARQTRAKWPWAAGIVLVVLVNVVVWGSQAGSCIDYAPGSGAESMCTSGPVIGVAGARVLGMASLLASAYFAFRLVPAIRRRP